MAENEKTHYDWLKNRHVSSKPEFYNGTKLSYFLITVFTFCDFRESSRLCPEAKITWRKFRYTVCTQPNRCREYRMSGPSCYLKQKSNVLPKQYSTARTYVFIRKGEYTNKRVCLPRLDIKSPTHGNKMFVW